MIKLTSSKDHPRDSYQPQTYFRCPLCDGRNSFYSVSPLRCHGCMKVIPLDFRKLMDDEAYRIKFHGDPPIHVEDSKNSER
jgi:hypothetical protein